MKEKLIENLNYRRYLLQNLIVKLNEKINHNKNKLHNDMEKLSTYENALTIVNRQIIRTVKRGVLPKVEIIEYKDELGKVKYLLKIDIDRSGKSIYKAINSQEIMFYNITGDTINDINLIHKIEELAFHYLSNHGDNNYLFNDLTEEVDKILEEFSNDDRVENRLENAMIRL
jgi:hypothetical protein